MKIYMWHSEVYANYYKGQIFSIGTSVADARERAIKFFEEEAEKYPLQKGRRLERLKREVKAEPKEVEEVFAIMGSA